MLENQARDEEERKKLNELMYELSNVMKGKTSLAKRSTLTNAASYAKTQSVLGEQMAKTARMTLGSCKIDGRSIRKYGSVKLGIY